MKISFSMNKSFLNETKAYELKSYFWMKLLKLMKENKTKRKSKL